jgi:SAM-dependent methyltransferase
MLREFNPETQQILNEQYFAGYDGTAGVYSADSVMPLDHFLQIVPRFIPLRRARVLQVGCATGHTIHQLRHAECHAFGIELSTWAISHVIPEAAPYVYWMDGENLEVFPYQAFDFTLTNMSSHVAPERIARWLKELMRISRFGVYLRYMTSEWAAKYKQQRSEADVQRYLPWDRDADWWESKFREARVFPIHRFQHPDWSRFVLLVRP